MDSALKQRLIGAAVLVLLAVIFLPMLVTGPAPDGSKDMQGVPANVPKAPDANVQLQGGDIDFDAPAQQPAAAVTPSQTVTAPVESVASGPSWMVDFAPYATASDAQMVVDALKAAGLASASSTPLTKSGKTVQQVIIGPFASVADAEKARVAAVKVSPVAAKVRRIQADVPVTASPTTPAITSPATPTASAKPAEAAKVETAAASEGPYAVQIGAFGNAGQADALHRKATAAGFNTILINGKDKEGRPVTRVRTTPVNTKQDAEALKAQVSMKLNRTGQVQKL